jgi:hypothetical protein
MNYMKKTTIALLFIAFCSVIALSSCSKDSDDDGGNDPTPTVTNELSFVVNGGAYTNQTFTFKATASAIYDLALDATGNSALLSFTGHTSGTYTISDDDGLGVFLNNNTTIMALTGGTIVVNTYGTVGNVISGTFSGTGVVSTNFGVPDTITLANGKFRATRVSK